MSTPGKCVLIVDDDEVVRRVTAGMVQALGFATAEAADGRSGLAAAMAVRPWLILSDMCMTEMNGVEFAEAVAARPELRGTPFLIVSGERPARTSSAVHAVIEKPLTLARLDQLLAALRPA